ncbi:MAG: GNAT family N-acetyltransferase [Bdellovibrionales bacterium]
MAQKYEIQEIRELTEDLLGEIFQLEKLIFKAPYGKKKIKSKLARNQRHILLIAKRQNEIVGYKFGYEKSKELFYSWIGGVSPSHRKNGIAKALMVEQHKLAKARGYRSVQTATKNQFKNMLIFNLKIGFEITKLVDKEGETSPIIILEKSL